jgi:undecaprenyl-diphosphatase
LMYILYSIIIWMLVSLTIQHFVHIDRPESAIQWVWLLLLDHLPDASFPSDHATVSIAFLTSIFLAWFRQTWLYYTPFVVLMLLSRIIVWVHWPFDIIAWIIVWIASSYVTFKYLTKIKILIKFNHTIIKLLWYIKL